MQELKLLLRKWPIKSLGGHLAGFCFHFPQAMAVCGSELTELEEVEVDLISDWYLDKYQFQTWHLIGQAVGAEARKEAVPNLL